MLEKSTQTLETEIRVENPTSRKIIEEFDKWQQIYKDRKSSAPSLNALEQVLISSRLREFGKIDREVRREVINYWVNAVPDDLSAWVIVQRDSIMREDHPSVLRFYLEASKVLGISSREK